MIPLAFAATMRIADTCGLDYWHTTLPATRALAASVAGVLPLSVWALLRAAFQGDTRKSGRHRAAAPLLAATWAAVHPTFVVASVRLTAQALVAPWVMFSVAGVWRSLHASHAVSGIDARLCLAAFVGTTALYIRPDFLLSVAGLLVIAMSGCLSMRGSQLLVITAGSCGALLGCIAIDRAFFGELVVTPVQWVSFNVLEGHAALTGESPALYYITDVLMTDPMMLIIAGAAAAVAMVRIVGCERRDREKENRDMAFSSSAVLGKCIALISCAVALIAAYSLQRHKEERFLLSAQIIGAIAGSAMVSHAVHRAIDTRLLGTEFSTRPFVYVALVLLMWSWHVIRTTDWHTDSSSMNEALAFIGRKISNDAALGAALPSVALGAVWSSVAAGTFLHVAAAVHSIDGPSSNELDRFYRETLCNDSTAFFVLPLASANEPLLLYAAGHGFYPVPYVSRETGVLLFMRDESMSTSSEWVGAVARRAALMHDRWDSVAPETQGVAAIHALGRSPTAVTPDQVVFQSTWLQHGMCALVRQAFEDLKAGHYRAAFDEAATFLVQPESFGERQDGPCATFAAYVAAWSSLRLDWHAEALAQFGRALRIDTQHDRSLASKAACWCHNAYHNGDMAGAWFLCSVGAMFGYHPSALEALNMLKLVIWQQGASHAVTQQWAHAALKMVQIEETRVDTHLYQEMIGPLSLLLGSMAQLQGFLAEASTTFQRALAHDPHNTVLGIAAGEADLLVGGVNIENYGLSGSTSIPGCARATRLAAVTQLRRGDVNSARGHLIQLDNMQLAGGVRPASSQEARAAPDKGLCRVSDRHTVVSDLVLRGFTEEPPRSLPKIQIVTLYDDAVDAMGEIWQAHFQAYADFHGYEVHVERGTLDADRPTAWSKIKLLRRIIGATSGSTCSENDPWLVWIDADVLVLNMSVPLARYVPTAPDVHFVVQADMHMMANTGVMLLRVCPWTERFLAAVWGMEHTIYSKFWENAAVVELLSSDEDVRRHTTILPYGALHSYPPNVAPGDLLLHCAGGQEKLAVLLRWSKSIAGQLQEELAVTGSNGTSDTFARQIQLATAVEPAGDSLRRAPRPGNITSVSVLVPVHDPDESFLHRGLASVAAAIVRARKNNLSLAADVVLVVDGATAGTLAMVKEAVREQCQPLFVDCKVHEGEASPRGAGWARNTAAQLASGEVLLFNDADDVWFPWHLERVLEAFNADPQLGYVKTRVRVADTRVHPDWISAIESSLVINLAVRAAAFHFVDGFLELPGAGGEDVALNMLLAEAFRGGQLEDVSVEYESKPGGTFAKQLEKFSRPRAEEHRYVAATGDGYDPEFTSMVKSRISTVHKQLRNFQPSADQLYLFEPALRRHQGG